MGESIKSLHKKGFLYPDFEARMVGHVCKNSNEKAFSEFLPKFSFFPLSLTARLSFILPKKGQGWVALLPCFEERREAEPPSFFAIFRMSRAERRETSRKSRSSKPSTLPQRKEYLRLERCQMQIPSSSPALPFPLSLWSDCCTFCQAALPTTQTFKGNIV